MNKGDLMNSNSGIRSGNVRPWRAAAAAAVAAQVDSYASCMRSHGDPGFYFSLQKGTPSPPPAGEDGTGIGGYVVYFDPSSPAYQAAMKACQHLSPFGSAGPGPSHQQFLEELKRANCMRSHGYPNYPDPNPTIGGQTFPVGGVANSPQFQAAAKTCGEPVGIPGG